MSKHILSSVALALGFLGAAAVSAQEPQPPQSQPSTRQTEGPDSGDLQPGRSPTQETQDVMREQQDPRMDPRPSTSQTEGTAADRTPPGRTPTDQGAQRGQMGDQMGREMVGASVISETQAPVGRVVDVVFSAANQPEFVVIESAGKTVAVPYSVANANKTANKIVIDESRLEGAPKMKQGEWRSQAEGTWKKDATRYWERDRG